MNYILTTSNLTKDFGGLRAVDNVDLKVKLGEIHALVGPNGSGKTTILNLLSGIYRPSIGVIRFKGQDISSVPIHSRTALGIGRTFQNIRLFESLSVLDNILNGLYTQMAAGLGGAFLRTPATRREEREMRERAMVICDQSNLGGKKKVLARNLSYGERRLLEIARAIACQPVLLLLDEPFSGTSPADVGQLSNIISGIRDSGTTIVLVEHHMRVVATLSDTVSVLNFGLLIASGTPKEILSNPKVIDAYLGKDEINA
jgi:ABC-type branched-subunit amino acid transport system ATPase component